MNKDNALDYLPLVQALAEGKTIQMLEWHGYWVDMVEISSEIPASLYRIKPEPREIFVVIDDDNDGSHIAFHSEDDAIKHVGSRGYAIRRYREVIE